MSRLAILEIHKEELKFSAGHFMILATDQRETMHGHDYQVSASFHTRILANGMAFDCRLYKQKLLSLCKKLDYLFLLPGQSGFMRIEDSDDHWICHIGAEKLILLKKDSIVLPICNATLEELSYWFLQQLINEIDELKTHGIEGITLTVYNGRGESGAAQWVMTEV